MTHSEEASPCFVALPRLIDVALWCLLYLSVLPAFTVDVANVTRTRNVV
jgi:uncharacterized RDD family membrane protein YckC